MAPTLAVVALLCCSLAEKIMGDGQQRKSWGGGGWVLCTLCKWIGFAALSCVMPG